ncbi:universal stress protein [Endozoicomonas sp. SM1973]|uniref:Universal stress protein n=1 Tax=Spartinivicinus marinus TaxID=2994442 RepID=A0A853HYK1_9GAMM|nr:universal stress protein [Spartinivicinus marinus]MCX4024700.1 universal stress protein [Spartinivicinus marinus]NYZ66273.1 universal stress protein [Spartinivicinus marinus]
MSLLSFNSVIVPIDFSEECVGAVNTALELVNSPKQVTLVHVKCPTTYITCGTAYVQLDEAEHTKQIEKHFQQFIQNHQWQELNWTLLTGKPGEEIVAYAKEASASLIIIPSHGYHGIKRLMLGSVAERVVRLAPCPVIVLRRGEETTHH